MLKLATACMFLVVRDMQWHLLLVVGGDQIMKLQHRGPCSGISGRTHTVKSNQRQTFMECCATLAEKG
jgi:hypothetical protein